MNPLYFEVILLSTINNEFYPYHRHLFKLLNPNMSKNILLLLYQAFAHFVDRRQL